MLICISTNFHSTIWQLTLTICRKHSQWTYSNTLSLQLLCHPHSPIFQVAPMMCVSMCVSMQIVFVWKKAAKFIVNSNKRPCISLVETEGDSTIQTLWQADSVRQHWDNSWLQQDNNAFVSACVRKREKDKSVWARKVWGFHDTVCCIVTVCTSRCWFRHYSPVPARWQDNPVHCLPYCTMCETAMRVENW